MKTSSSSNNMGNQDCPFCMGLGFVKKDVPVEHPDFGKAVPCSCIEPKIKETRRQQMNALGALEMLNEMTFENFRSSGVALPAERQQTLRAGLRCRPQLRCATHRLASPHRQFRCGEDTSGGGHRQRSY